ncbi:TM2 domain-containing protein [Eubacteriales bacterium OttesenSCG-928-M02]|nr:TM2 domain-containing protein [Eubacteriales bacterium OttesenSCG-928-M02]
MQYGEMELMPKGDNRVDFFLATNAKLFPQDRILFMKEALENMAPARREECLLALQSISYQNPTMLTIMAVILGRFGVDRFMLREIGMGMVKLVLTLASLVLVGVTTYYQTVDPLYYYYVMAQGMLSAQLIVSGIVSILWLVDIFKMGKKARQKNFEKAQPYLS